MPSETITYTTKIQDASCEVVDSITVFIANQNEIDCRKLLLPKAFTPNNDGLNDTYGISNTFIIEDLEFFEIYDRTGALIWKTSDVNEKWDATFNGQPVNVGMFLYKVKYTCSNEKQFSTGSFTILR
jgi:gliding motility-associated-like protein